MELATEATLKSDAKTGMGSRGAGAHNGASTQNASGTGPTVPSSPEAASGCGVCRRNGRSAHGEGHNREAGRKVSQDASTPLRHQPHLQAHYTFREQETHGKTRRRSCARWARPRRSVSGCPDHSRCGNIRGDPRAWPTELMEET